MLFTQLCRYMVDDERGEDWFRLYGERQGIDAASFLDHCAGACSDGAPITENDQLKA